MKNSIYFYITYKRKEKEDENDIEFIDSEEKSEIPECIYVDYNYENGNYYYSKIYKASKSAGKGKKGNNYYFEYEIGDEKYIISFDSKGCTFVYDINLEVGKTIIKIKRKINQNKEYNEKIDSFINALKKKGEENLIEELFNETIELYKNKKGFSFLIGLFLKIYKNKELCPKLLKIFKEMNANPKEKRKNMDRKAILKDYTSDFKSIISEADKLIDNYKYEIMDFYGIILCYLNCYDYATFSSIINKFFKEKKCLEKKNYLYEILLIYDTHFINPINQEFNFFSEFINYTALHKDFTTFEKSLNYIRDIETFLRVVEKNNEDILSHYNSEKNR